MRVEGDPGLLWFYLTLLCKWFEKTCAIPRTNQIQFASFYFEFSLAYDYVNLCSDWSLQLLWLWFLNSQLSIALISFDQHFCHTDMHIKWERSNLEKYVLFDKKKWRYSDQDKDGMLNRQEYEYFHHPKEHEIMLPYIAVVSKPVFLVWFSWFDTLTSVCTFSILFSIHFISYWQAEFIYQSRPSLAGDRFLYSRDLNIWFSCDIVRRNWMQVTFRDQRVKTSLRNQAIHTNAIVFSQEILDRYDKDEDGRLSLDEYLGKWFR